MCSILFERMRNKYLLKPLLALAALLLIPVIGGAAEAPRSGGELVFAVGEIPPSFDGHRETTFGMLHPVAPHR